MSIDYSKIRVLVACEYSNIVSQAFRNQGCYVLSCDLDECNVPGSNHYQGNVFDIINDGWDIMIAHPPCTYLCKAQLWRVSLDQERRKLQDKALDFVVKLSQAPIDKIAIENPIGALSRLFRPPEQLIYPYQFGDPYRKDIHLWLKNLPPLLPTLLSPGRKSMSNHVNSRMSQAEKSKIKSRFFVGVANAMASQWL